MTREQFIRTLEDLQDLGYVFDDIRYQQLWQTFQQYDMNLREAIQMQTRHDPYLAESAMCWLDWLQEQEGACHVEALVDHFVTLESDLTWQEKDEPYDDAYYRTI